MKYFLAIIIIGFVLEGTCQKIVLEGDTARFVCKSDSVEFNFKKDYLEVNKIDTLIELHYFYDNGRYEDEMNAFIWREDGHIKLKAFSGCDSLTETAILEYQNSKVFETYFQDSLFTENHNLYSVRSHDYGYWFSIKQKDFFNKGYIRDDRRGKDNFHKNGAKKKRKDLKEAEKNPLVKWLNQIDNQLLKAFKKK